MPADAPKDGSSVPAADERLAVPCPDCRRTLRAPRKLAGKSVKCPGCGAVVRIPDLQPPASVKVESPPPAVERVPSPTWRQWWITCGGIIAVAALTYGFAIYASLHANDNNHLGAEYFNIAKSIYSGEGFSSPFGERTGPTAWMPPVLPTILASLLWAADGDRGTVRFVVTWSQVHVLLATAVLTLLLLRSTTRHLALATLLAVALFAAFFLAQYRNGFATTHDCWLVLLTLDLLTALLCWRRPLGDIKAAAWWGLFGGFCGLVGPIVGWTWGVMSIAAAIPERRWRPLGMALMVAMMALTPWTVRNLLVFGRLIPIKSNLGYELYQSQCIAEDGILHPKTFRTHPYGANNAARREYRRLGEIAFIDSKRELFWKSVADDPLDYFERAAGRFMAAFLEYETFDLSYERPRPWIAWANAVTHPLAFCALVFLLLSAIVRPLPRTTWLVIGVFLSYMLPYVVISYYERYALPMLGLKVLLIVCAADRLLTFVTAPPWRKVPTPAAEGKS